MRIRLVPSLDTGVHSVRNHGICHFKIDDTVVTTIPGFSGRFVVTRIDRESETADLESHPSSEGSTYILASVRWEAIHSLNPIQSEES